MQAYDIRPCLGELAGHQDAWKPLLDISTASHCKVAAFDTHELRILSIEISTGHTIVEQTFDTGEHFRNLSF